MAEPDPITKLILNHLPISIATIVSNYARRSAVDGLFLRMEKYGKNSTDTTDDTSAYSLREFGDQRIVVVNFLNKNGVQEPIIFADWEIEEEFWQIITKQKNKVCLSEREIKIRQCVQIGCNYAYSEFFKQN